MHWQSVGVLPVCYWIICLLVAWERLLPLKMCACFAFKINNNVRIGKLDPTEELSMHSFKCLPFRACAMCRTLETCNLETYNLVIEKRVIRNAACKSPDERMRHF